MDSQASTDIATDVELRAEYQTLPQNDRYKPLMTLGRGGQATVYLAQENKTNSLFALKYTQCRDADDWQHFRKCYRGEVTSLTALLGTVAPRLYDFGTINGSPYIAMEHITGPTLYRRVKTRKPKLDEAITLFDQITAGASIIHQKNIAHRDIKSTNIMLSSRGPLYIDFGISAPFNEEYAISAAEASTSHGIHGTHLSVAPEQLQDPKRVHPTLDIYSLGVLAHYLFCGTEFRRFPEPSKPFQRAQLIMSTNGRIGYERPTLPARLVELIETCTAPKPADRFQTCEEIRSHLKTS